MKSVPVSAPAWVASALEHCPQSRQITVDGCKINYLCWNPDELNKPALLLAHGFCAHAHWWDFVAPALLDAYRVFAIDFSGMGDSGYREHYSHATYCRELVAIIDAENLAPVRLVGHSFGGLISIQTTARYPDKIHALTVIDSRISFPRTADDKPPGRGASELKPKRVYPTLDQALARFRLIPEQNCADPAVFEYVARLSLREEAGGWVWKFDDRITHTLEPVEVPEADLLKTIHCPTVFIYGTESIVAPKEIAEKTVGYMANGRPPIAVSKAHHHVLLDQPRVLRDILRTVLNELDADR